MELLKEEADDLSSERGVDYSLLRHYLKWGMWKEADDETLRVILKAARREKEGYLRVEDMDNFPSTDLRTIDKLWVKYSKSRFGFSVQNLKVWVARESMMRKLEKLLAKVGFWLLVVCWICVTWGMSWLFVGCQFGWIEWCEGGLRRFISTLMPLWALFVSSSSLWILYNIISRRNL